MPIGLMGAMPEEMDKVIAAITDKKVVERGSRLYFQGKLFGQDVVAVFSRWGKVAAATTATHLILDFKVDNIIFTGIAGAVLPTLNVGDIVVAQRLFQHDMDARPLLRRFEIPLTGKTSFEIPNKKTELMSEAVHLFLKNNQDFRRMLTENNITNPKMMLGDIASGDLFISSNEMKQAIIQNLPSVICAEMEGAAVAQVCHDYEIPLQVVRVISDAADELAHESATNFVKKYGGNYALGILKEYFELIK